MMKKLLNPAGLFDAMKRVILIAFLLVVLALVAAGIWYALQPKATAVAREECSGDPEDYKNCIERETRLEEECAGKTGEELQACASAIVYNGLETPDVTVTTGVPVPP